MKYFKQRFVGRVEVALKNALDFNGIIQPQNPTNF